MICQNKKIIRITTLFFTMLIGFFFPITLLASDDGPRPIYLTAFPLSNEKIQIYGKLGFIDEDKPNNYVAFHPIKNFLSKRCKNFPVNVLLEGSEIKTTTDGDGEFFVTFDISSIQQRISEHVLTLTYPKSPTIKWMWHFRVPSNPTCLLVSDIDDTVLVSYGKKPGLMIFHLFVQNFNERREVPGTPEIYQELWKGPNGDAENLLVFLSGSPSYLGMPLNSFFHAKKFPCHTILLRKLGLGEYIDHIFRNHPLEGESDPDVMEYKLTRIGKLFYARPDLPAILLGDSRQKDPEVYLTAYKTFPGRVKAVIIHDVTGQPASDPRYQELSQLPCFILWKDPKELRKALKATNLIP